MRGYPGGRRRRGVILVLSAMMMVLLTSLVALGVDLGRLAAARDQLKTVTDAAALAGARQLISDRRISTTISDLSPEMTTARAKAIIAGNANKVLGSTVPLTSSNIVIGYKKVTYPSPDAPTASVNTAVSSTQFNSVQVTATVTLAAIFTKSFRPNGSSVTVTSTATAEVVAIKGFQSLNGASAGILPIVMDQATYSRMIAGSGGDSYAFTPGNYNSTTGATGVTSGADGAKESVAYPVASGLSGNWGTINFGVSNNSTSILGNQIQYGISPAQMLAEYPNGLVTVPHQFSANPGISAGIKGDLSAIIGKAVTAPIYDTSGGNGNNAWYHVVAFASVRIVAVQLTGSNKYVIVQPAIASDTTAIRDTLSPLGWSNGGMAYVHLTR